MEEIYTPEEVAEKLKISVFAVRDWLRRGRLQGFKLNERDWRVRERDLQAFVDDLVERTPYVPDLADDNDDEAPAEGELRTQRITEADVKRGFIRIPASVKPRFPSSNQWVDVLIDGEHHHVSYRPSGGHSGRLAVGRELLHKLVESAYVTPGMHLELEILNGETYHLTPPSPKR